MMANERHSRVAVVHGCFPERGDSILSYDCKPYTYIHVYIKHFIIITRSELASLALSLYVCGSRGV